ncbi:hypothetical protein JCM15457_2056 [Liquorilactobacillus sucicola DSM 21376 = JCM 15457]|uniref:Uncharacterized protein n=1 Tax=Liquorilactobacillus sucicola DSM 21376 = JCM 15457 TaxID=1423806 RepID=A0A023CZ45_9LACO|nr:hypothetical protein [Liquorilactobacillus sucicola]KRN06648.1 hypothetical protein FD15_GL000198 [Liquorilactobacillus sucicola DSM 21376 = JCM 15457]GAJ27094.1 hypothetical protein JCM15457_2056 [Liquorilactobacillus sucicola DSM 21376 = JCM 15457]
MIYTYVFEKKKFLQKIVIVPVLDRGTEFLCDIFVGSTGNKVVPTCESDSWSRSIAKDDLCFRKRRIIWVTEKLKERYGEVKIINAEIEVSLQIEVGQNEKLFGQKYNILNVYCELGTDFQHENYLTEVRIFPSTEKGEQQKVCLKRSFTLENVESQDAIMRWLKKVLKRDIPMFEVHQELE